MPSMSADLRIATWNVMGTLRGKLAQLHSLRADILILTEVHGNQMARLSDVGPWHWSGPENRRSGVAVVALNGWAIEAASTVIPGQAFAPVILRHPTFGSIRMLACCVKKGETGYQANALQALERVDSWLAAGPSFLAGDFNMHGIGGGAARSKRFFMRLCELGYRSAWHHVHNEQVGRESAPTFLSPANGGFHIDYIFACHGVLPLRAEIVENATLSDHFPLFAEFKLYR